MFLLLKGLFVDCYNERFFCCCCCFDKNSLKILPLLNGREEKMDKETQ